MEYIQLPDDFVEKWQGFMDGVNIFYAFKVLSGKHQGKFVCNKSSRAEFPKLFKEIDLVVLELDYSDFEIDYQKLDIVVDQKFPILRKIEDYVNKTVTIEYVEDGEKRKYTIDIDQTATKSGYVVDIEKEIKDKPEEIKEVPEIKEENPIESDDGKGDTTVDTKVK